MSCKVTKVLLLICAFSLIFHQTEAIIFTVGGVVLDSALALFLFGKFLAIPLLFGKRNVDTQLSNVGSSTASAEHYLVVANSVDIHKCIPLAICTAMARSNDTTAKPTEFDNLIIEKFQHMLKESDSVADQVSPMHYYLNAAKVGASNGNVNSCHLSFPFCDYSLKDLYQLTRAISRSDLMTSNS